MRRYLVLFVVVCGLAALQIYRNRPTPKTLDAQGRYVEHHGKVEIAWELDPAAAFERAGSKPVLAFFTADWCPPCRELKSGALADDAVRSQIRDEFVPLYVDLTQPDAAVAEFATRYGVRSIPQLLVIGSDGSVRRELSGTADTGSLSDWLASN